MTSERGNGAGPPLAVAPTMPRSLAAALLPERDGIIPRADHSTHLGHCRSPLAVWGSKEMLNYGRDHSIDDTLRHIAVWQTGMFQPTDMREAFAAKSEKRDPVFDDLLPVSDAI